MDYRLRQYRARIRELCAPHVYTWLRELGDAVRESGAYPISLCDYYADPRDKEVAGVVGLLVPSRRPENYIFELRHILGDSPSAMVESRAFLHLNESRKILDNRGIGVGFSDVFNVLDWIWAVRHKRGLPLEQAIISELGYIKKSHAEPLSLVIPNTDFLNRLRMLLAKMAMKGGYGAGIWSYLDERVLSLPDTRGIRDVMRRYFPMNKRLRDRNINDIASFMGFDKPINFLYTYWGYGYAVAAFPAEVEALERKIEKSYGSLRIKTPLACDLPTYGLFG